MGRIRISTGPRLAGAAAAALLLLAGCSTSGNWHFLRERPSGKSTTRVTVTSEPAGAEVTLNGQYMGTTPFVVPIEYPYSVRVFERRTALPYPHVEQKDVNTYRNNRFTFRFHAIDHDLVEKTIELNGEETAEVHAVLPEGRSAK